MAKIIYASNGAKISESLSNALSIESIKAEVNSFADGELRVQLPYSLYKQDVIIVQSTCKPVNDNLMELLLIIDAAKRAGSTRIIAVIPYFGYSRQDKTSYQCGPISGRVVATMLEAAGVEHIITLDLHSKQIEGFFNISIQNINTNILLASMLRNLTDIQNTLLVSPDIGGIARTKELATLIDADIAIMNKNRDIYNQCKMQNIIGDVDGKKCIIVDDILDTGHTLCKAAELLISEKAASVQAFITHSVLSNNAAEKLQNSAIERITTTTSIPQTKLPDKFFIIDIAPLISDALKKVI